MNRVLKPIIYLIAAIYFLVDAIFVPVVQPITTWLSTHWIWKDLRVWIVSLQPYPTLMLFAMPVIILEPVKPVAAYLAATGHVAAGTIVLIVGELLKLVLVERLFSITREKLMSIPAFAWAYRKYASIRDQITESAAWQLVQRWNRFARYAIRSFLLDMKALGDRGLLPIDHGDCNADTACDHHHVEPNWFLWPFESRAADARTVAVVTLGHLAMKMLAKQASVGNHPCALPRRRW